MKRINHIIGTTPEQIAETDREFMRHFIDLYDNCVRRLNELKADLTIPFTPNFETATPTNPPFTAWSPDGTTFYRGHHPAVF